MQPPPGWCVLLFNPCSLQVSRAVLSTILEGSVTDLQDASAVAIAQRVAALVSAAVAAGASDAAASEEPLFRIVSVHEGEVVIRLSQPSMLPQVGQTTERKP